MTILLNEVVKNGATSLMISYLNWLSRGILLETVFSTLRLIFSENDFLVGLCIFNYVHNKVDSAK